jgi:hypothetical protein
MTVPVDAAAASSTPVSAPAPTPAAPAAPLAPAVGPAPAAGIPGRRFLVVNAVALGVGAVLLALGLAWPAGDRTRTSGQDEASASANSPRSDGGGVFEQRLRDDGKAEVARYAAERVVDGAPRTFELVAITAKERFDPATGTKTDADRSGAVDAIKLVRVEDVPSGRAYAYHQLLTVHVARHEPERVLRAALGSQEWCGNTFALVLPRGGELVRHVHSYWDGEGDREERLPEGAWLEDQLPLTLRAFDLAPGFKRNVRLVPTLVSNKQEPLAAARASIVVVCEDRLQTPLGTRTAAQVCVVREGRADTRLVLWFDRGEGHALLRWDMADGRRGEIRSLTREAYWIDGPSSPGK